MDTFKLFILSLVMSLQSGLLCGEGIKTATAPLSRAVFAGGCFWCMEAPFDKLPGVAQVTVGYTGGQTKNPSYKEVSLGDTGHAEAIEITFDPKLTSYETLLDVFWHQIDPTVKNAQFCDHGTQYRAEIFYDNEQQKKSAQDTKDQLQRQGPFKGKLVTEISPAGVFYPAEDYHQHYYKKNPLRYKYYRFSCGRDQYLDQVWGKNRSKSEP